MICMYIVVLCSSSVSGSVGVQLCVGQCQPLMLPVGVLTCGSLWVNVSSSNSGSVDMRLVYGSMSAPPTGILTPNSLVSSLLRYVWHICVQYVASLESLAQSFTQKSAVSQPRVLAPAPCISSQGQPQTFQGVRCHLHGDNVCCAALKQGIMMALAAFAASPFLIEGMW